MVPRQQAQMVKKNRKVHLTFDRKHLGWFPRFFKENVLWTDKPKLQKQKVCVPLHLAENSNSLYLKQKKTIKTILQKRVGHSYVKDSLLLITNAWLQLVLLSFSNTGMWLMKCLLIKNDNSLLFSVQFLWLILEAC